MDYLPKTETQLLEWLKNFSEQLKLTGGTLGITPAEISSLNALILDVKGDMRESRNDSDIELKKQSMFKFLNGLIDKMKKNPAYRDSEHGKKLGLV